MMGQNWQEIADAEGKDRARMEKENHSVSRAGSRGLVQIVEYRK